MPPVTVDTIRASDAQGLSNAGHNVVELGEVLQARAEEALEATHWGPSWQGSAAEAASHAADSSSAPVLATGLSLVAGGWVTQAHSRVVEAVQTVVHSACAAARSAGCMVSPDGTVTPGALVSVPALGTALNALAGALSAVLRAALAFIRASDAGSSTALQALVAGSPAIPGPPRGLPTGLGGHAPASVDISFGSAGPVVTVGDVASAEQVITLVSGVGSSEPGATEKTTAWARTQVEEAAKQGRSIAVVAWHDYNAPSNLVAGATPFASREAAPELASFQRDLRAVNPHAELKVIGYSYGSAVVGTAIASSPGVEADAVEFWGSPGTPIQPASSGGSGHPMVSARSAPGDLISGTTGPWGGVHGVDPMRPKDDSASSWGGYAWRKLLDGYVISRGELDSHSSYVADPQVTP